MSGTITMSTTQQQQHFVSSTGDDKDSDNEITLLQNALDQLIGRSEAWGSIDKQAARLEEASTPNAEEKQPGWPQCTTLSFV